MPFERRLLLFFIMSIIPFFTIRFYLHCEASLLTLSPLFPAMRSISNRVLLIFFFSSETFV
jgi:hypothetical protein